MFGNNGSKMGKVDTMIGPGAEIKGNMHIKGSIYIDGRVEGNVQTEDGIMMGEHGSVKGNLTASNIIIGGKVHGHINGHQRVELLASAVVDGDIKTPRVLIAEGSIFEGTCEMDQAPDTGISSSGKAKSK